MRTFCADDFDAEIGGELSDVALLGHHARRLVVVAGRRVERVLAVDVAAVPRRAFVAADRLGCRRGAEVVRRERRGAGQVLQGRVTCWREDDGQPQGEQPQAGADGGVLGRHFERGPFFSKTARPNSTPHLPAATPDCPPRGALSRRAARPPYAVAAWCREPATRPRLLMWAAGGPSGGRRREEERGRKEDE